MNKCIRISQDIDVFDVKKLCNKVNLFSFPEKEFSKHYVPSFSLEIGNNM